MNKLLILISIGFLQVSSLAHAQGTESGGGGDHISLQAQHIANDLPQFLHAIGEDKFPEVDMATLKSKIKENIRFELLGSLSVNNSPKDLKNFPKLDLVQIDPVNWENLTRKADGLLQKTALIFHECLSLMKLEGNNDYHISHRILSAGGLRLIVSERKLHLIVSGLNNDNSAILVMEGQDRDHEFEFYYCTDQRIEKTCNRLGDRKYRFEEVQKLTGDLQAVSTYGQWSAQAATATLLCFAGTMAIFQKTFATASPLMRALMSVPSLLCGAGLVKMEKTRIHWDLVIGLGLKAIISGDEKTVPKYGASIFTMAGYFHQALAQIDVH